MSALTSRSSFVDILDWLETPWAILRPHTSHLIRVEDYVKDGQYVVRAELPGLDPATDIDVTVSNRVLTISAHRSEQTEDTHRSEFHYGALARSIPLPAGADKGHIQASYDRGVLKVVVSIRDQDVEEAHKHVPVRQIQHIKPT